MSELRNYILSKLEEKIASFSDNPIQDKAARAAAADALKAVKKRFQQSGLAKKPGDAAKLAQEYSQETYKHKPKPEPKPENSSTDLRTQLAYVLADKLEEYRGKRFGYEPGEAPARGKGALKTAVGDALSKMRYGTTKPAEVEGGVIKDPGTRGGISTPVRTELGNLSQTGRWKKIEAIPGMPKLPSRADNPSRTAPRRKPKPEKPKPENSSTILKDRMVDILLERKVNSFLERTDEGIIGGGLRGLYQGVKKSFNKDYNPEASKQASIETHGLGHTAAQHTGRLAGRALGGVIKTAGAALRGGGRGIVQGIKKSRDANYNPEAHKQANSATQGLVSAYSQKAGQAVGKGLGAAGGAIKRGVGAAGGMIKRGFNKMMQRESSAYGRITNMLLESRVEMFIQDRLDEVIGSRNKAKVTTVSRGEAAKLLQQARQSGNQKPASSKRIFGKKVTFTGGNEEGRSVGIVKPEGGDTTSLGIARIGRGGRMNTRSVMVGPRKPPNT